MSVFGEQQRFPTRNYPYRGGGAEAALPPDGSPGRTATTGMTDFPNAVFSDRRLSLLHSMPSDASGPNPGRGAAGAVRSGGERRSRRQ